jgi:hypothetical protein
LPLLPAFFFFPFTQPHVSSVFFPVIFVYSLRICIFFGLMLLCLSRQRIEKIKAHALERGKVFGEINDAREEAHRQTCARNDNKQSAIGDSVAGYKRIHAVKQRQMEAKIYEEDKRVRQILDAKKDLLFKRNVAAHHAVLRKQEIRDKLATMKATQNFKGLKKLTASFGFDLDADDAKHAAAAHAAKAGGGGGASGAEPTSPPPKSP